MTDVNEQKEALHLLQEKNPQALEEFVKTRLPSIYNLCLRLCERKTDAEDICQETFVKAIRSIEQFKGEANVSTWLHRIAINTWKNRVRYEKRRFFNLHLSLFSSQSPDDSTPTLDVPDTSPSPEQRMESIEKRETLQRALDRLPPDEKVILLLRDVHDKSYEEIADILTLNLGTVKSRLSRARDHFRNLYQELLIQNP